MGSTTVMGGTSGAPSGGFVLTEPILTERLVLRALVPGDLVALHEMFSDPEVVRYLYDEPFTLEAARVRLERAMSRTMLRDEDDSLILAAECRATGAFVAELILHWVSRAHLSGEIGYVVHPRHAGKGYATEAARALLGVAFDELGLHRVVGRLEARNIASARVLEKLGMRREALLVENEWVKGEWQSEVVSAILDREWEALRLRS